MRCPPGSHRRLGGRGVGKRRGEPLRYLRTMDVTAWLLEGDPAIRWQVRRDLTGAPSAEVVAERSRVATEGWGARLLALQADDGQWGGGVYSPKWISTTYTLLLLRHLGVDPAVHSARAAIGRVRAGVTMGSSDWPFFSYRGETCVTGMVLALGAYFDRDRATSDDLVDFLLDQHLADGGWNCEAARSGSVRSSFNTTISVMEGLTDYQQAFGPDVTVAAAWGRGAEYLLERRLLRSLRSGDPINTRWKLLSFPPRWHYDVLRGLDQLREAGAAPDPRCDEAIAVVEGKRSKDGRWPLQNHHPGREHFRMEHPGEPSRWNTLRARRVLRWAGRS